MLLLTYSFVYPTWTGYDEAQHVDMVVGLEHGDGWPGPGQRIIAQGVARTSDAFDRGGYADFFLSGGKNRGKPPFVEIAPTPRDRRQSFDAMGGDTPVTDGRLSNQMVQHPPLVYAIGAVILKAVPGSSGWSYDVSVWVLRLLNILIVAPLPLLGWAAARRFGLRGPLCVAASIVPLAVPGLTRVGATFDNDGLLTLSTGALTVVLAGVARGDLRKRSAVLAGLWLGVALLSKAFALLLPFMVVAAYLIGANAGRIRDGVGGWIRKLPWAPAVICLGIGSAVGLWFWIRNLVLYGAVEPNGWGTDPPRREALLLPKSFFTWFWYFLRTMVARFWGGLGLFEPPTLSPWVVVPATAVVLVACAVVVARRHQTLAERCAPWMLLLPIAFAFVMTGERSYGQYRIYTRGIAIQGRYLYLGIVGLAVVVALGAGRLARGRERERFVPAVVLAAALAVQAAALVTICTYYWVPRGHHLTPDRVRGAIAGIARWAPFPIGVTVATFAATVVAAVVAAVLAARSTRRPTPIG
jgi:hypothetical protein